LPKTADGQERKKIGKMAVVTSLATDGVDISHHGGITSNRYIALFGLAPVLAVSGAQKAMAVSGLNGYSHSLEEKLANFDARKVMDEAFARLFLVDFETVDPLEVRRALSRNPSRQGDTVDRKAEDYTVLRTNFGVDSILRINFTHGLEVHGETLGAAVIDADVTLIRLDDNEALLEKSVSSAKFAKTWHNIADFAANDARLYRREFSKATEAIVYLVGLDLGFNLGDTGKFYWQQDEKAEEEK
jgi:hypothetical protein